MATVTLIKPVTAAVVSHVKFSTDSYQDVILSASGLATTEEVDIFIAAGSGWVLAVDKQGAVAKLTATKPSIELPAGPIYGILKDATASAAGVSVTLNGKW